MALQINPIGAVKGIGGIALPTALRGSRGLGKGLSFAGTLDQKLLDLSGGDNSQFSQIAGLIQAGTPMATIVDRIVKDPNVRGTLERALASALAPPGTSPPTSSGTKHLAALLEQQIAKLVTTLKSETTTAGQQSEFPGQVLDAKTARETPAQQKNPTPTGTPVDEVTSFAQMLIQKAAAPANTPATQTSDILARMLARAANADAQRTATTVQRTGQVAAAPATVPAHTTTTTTPSSVLFDRLIAIIAEHKSGTQSDANGGKQFSQDAATAQAPLPASTHQAQSNLPSGPVLSTQFASASAPAAPAQAATHYTAVDPQLVIEQLVKGIAMRNSGATSEVRMRLQPEQLGEVALKLTVTGNTITANVIAQNAHVRDLLLNNQQQLARSLADAGLALGNFSVNVSGGNTGFTQQQTPQQRRLVQTNGFGHALAAEEEPGADSRFGPPLLPAGKALVLNYLA